MSLVFIDVCVAFFFYISGFVQLIYVYVQNQACTLHEDVYKKKKKKKEKVNSLSIALEYSHIRFFWF